MYARRPSNSNFHENLGLALFEHNWRNLFGSVCEDSLKRHIVWKSPKNVSFDFWILAFSANFCPTEIDLSGNTVWPQASGFQKLVKLTIFGIFYELLSTQIVNLARFAHNVEWDFFSDFQTPCWEFLPI